MATASELPKLYQGVHKESFGFKMLATMGWKEGQGLGANNQGIKEHIKVKKKQDAFGVGAAEQAHKLRDWTTGMVGYDAILSGLKEITRSAKADSSSSDDSDSSSGHSSGYDSDSDTSSDAAACKAAVSKKKKAKKGKEAASKKKQGSEAAAAEGKDSSSKKKRKQQEEETAVAKKRQKRSKKADSSSSDDSGSSSGSESGSDGEPAAAAASGAAALGKVSRVRAATHVGRYAKRERAKTVRNYSATDLAAILGLPTSAPVVEGGEGADAWAAAAAAAAGNNARQDGSSGSSSSEDDSSSSGSDSDTDDSSSSGKEGSEQRLRPGTPEGSDTPPSRTQQGPEQDSLQSKPSGLGVQNPDVSQCVAEGADSKVWWRSLFVKSGGSGSSIGMKVAGKAGINAHGFLEDDQTNLYMQAHANATTGKQGLGRSSMPKKVAGARWQGTKTKLGSDDEDDEQQQQQQQQEQHEAAVDSIAAAAAASGREQYVKNGILIVLPLKKQPSQQQQQQQQEEPKQKDAQQGKKEKQGKKQKKGAADSPAQQQEPQKQQQQQQPAGKKRKQQEAAAATEPSSSKKAKKAAAAEAAGKVSQKSVKWAKLAAKILQGAPKRRMRIQKLHKQVVAAAGYDVSSPGVDTEALYQQMLKKLRKAEGLEVCEKYVGLVKA